MKMILMICLILSFHSFARVTTGNEGNGKYVPKELEANWAYVQLAQVSYFQKRDQLADIDAEIASIRFDLKRKEQLQKDRIAKQSEMNEAKAFYERKLAQFDQAVLRLEQDKVAEINKKNATASPTPAGPPIPQLTAEEKNYKPETCVWSNDIPKRLVFGPGCKDSQKRICVGYVICDQKDPAGKFVRMSTCSQANCADDKAVECTKENGYGSRKPDDKANISVSSTVQAIMLQTEGN